MTCDEARIICHKTQYKDASVWEILKLKFHLLVCNACASFSRKNTKLTTLCEEAALRNLSDKDKFRMKKILEEEI
ncbi:MAG: hypothetical protein ABF293_13855 [Flavobacteriaceae bacterium]